MIYNILAGKPVHRRASRIRTLSRPHIPKFHVINDPINYMKTWGPDGAQMEGKECQNEDIFYMFSTKNTKKLWYFLMKNVTFRVLFTEGGTLWKKVPKR